ncbi:MAG: hypothetical protein LBL86_03180 [Coriobacteriales bacterium]|jgi:hypothetical protein|nr:hypothetical protein [Coriobacteriales bacterium]
MPIDVAQSNQVSRLIIERRKGGLIIDRSTVWPWDVYVDGHRIDALYQAGSRVTIERDGGFVCFIRCENGIYEETSEIRINVKTGQSLKLAYVYKKVFVGWDFQRVPWDKSP